MRTGVRLAWCCATGHRTGSGSSPTGTRPGRRWAVADVQRVQAEKDAAARRADEILHGPRDGAKLTHRHLDGTIWDGPACGLHYDGEQPLPLTECRWHYGLAGDDHF